MSSSRGVCPPTGGDVAGEKLPLWPCGGQICALLPAATVQQLFPAGCTGTAALSAQCAPRKPQKGEPTSISTALKN